jgi:EmrB/QacA subfamily drug resistance transporter
MARAETTAASGTPHPQSHKGLVIIAVLLATALSALDANIVGTAIPTIVGQLQGLTLLPWLVASFNLTATTTVPLFGKLSDIYGRKSVLMVGSALFLIGSVLCGFAGSMEQLILFRALQGIGAGSVVPVTLTLIGDLFTLDERARLQGIFSAVWGVSSVLGPLVGGLLVTTIGWPWIFFVNVPFGLAAMALLWLFLREPVRPAGSLRRIDFPGAATLTFGIAALLLALSFGSSAGWFSAPVVGLFVGGLVLLAAFVVIERRTAEPIVQLGMLSSRTGGISALAGFLGAAVLFGGGAYLPLLVQGVWQGTPLEAGLALAPLSLGWPLASTISGRLILRYGYWPVAFGGAILVLIGTTLMLPLGLTSPVWLLPVAAFVQGVGFGLSFTSLLIAVQNAVGWEGRGAATSIYQFSRNLGGTVAAASLGVVLTSSLASRLAALPALTLPAGTAGSGDQLGAASILLDPVRRGTLDAATRLDLQTILSDSISTVLWLLAGIALLALVATWFFPRTRAQDDAAPEPLAGESLG